MLIDNERIWVRLHLVQAVAEAVDDFLAVICNLAYINALEQFL